MKKRLLITGMLSVASLAFAQVGVNTPQAETTFDIVAKDSKGTSQVPEGLLIPRVDRERAQSMVGVPISTLIYINDISTGSAAGIAANVDEVGYYYYNGTVWTKIAGGSSDNIHVYNSNGTITSDRIVSLEDKGFAFNGTRNNGFAVNKVGDNPSSVISADMENARVGIGTNTPQAKLDIRTSTNAYGFQHSDDNIRLRSWIDDKVAFFGNITDHGLNLMTNNTARLYITNDGNVGIGAHSPTDKLHVAGSVKIADGTQGANKVLTSDDSGKASWKDLPADKDTNIYSSNGTLTSNRTVAQTDKTLAFTGTETNAFSVDGDTFSVDAANDRIGIGTLSPTDKLHVEGSVKIADGTQGANKVLTSDASGKASWKDLPATSNTNVYNSNGTITSDRIVSLEDKGFSFNGTRNNGFAVNKVGDNPSSVISADMENARVGIGTNTPQAKLDIRTSTNAYGFQHSDDNIRLRSWIDDKVAFFGNISDHGLNLMTNNRGRIYITNDGNVGIGTNSPTDKLHVAGSVKIADGTQGANKVLTSDDSGKASWKDLPATSNVYNSNGTITSERIISLEDKSFAFNGTRHNGFAVNKVGDNPSSVISADLENARVGIGTNSPTDKLHVMGSVKIEDGTQGANKVLTSDASGKASWKDLPATSNTNVYNSNGTITSDRVVDLEDKGFAFNGTRHNGFAVNKVGDNPSSVISADMENARVGIGTHSPETKFEVATADRSWGIQHTNGSVKLSSYIESANGALFGTRTNHPLSFSTNNAVRMKIAETGNVGIGTGTNAPETKLEVATADRSWGIQHTNGSVKLSSYIESANGALFGTRTNHPLSFSTNSAVRMKIAETGNVGIGTLSPTDKLHVAGSIKIADGTQGANKVLTSDASGKASWKDLPATSNTNVYNSNGTITSDRVVDLENKGFAFNGNRHNGFAVNKVGDNASSVLSADLENARVGIGTHSPTDKLHVAGKVRIEDGTQGINRVLTSDANGVASWKTSSAVTPTVLGSVNHIKRFVNDYSLIGSSVTLTPGRWLIHIGQLVTNKTEATQTNNLWVRITLSSSSSSLMYSGFNFLGASLVSGWLSPSISQSDGEGFSFLSGVIPVNVTSNITLYTWFRDNSRTSGTPPTAHVGSNQENYLFATPVN